MPKVVAVAVHLQDVDLVGEAVQQRSGEAFRAEDLGPFVEGQVGGDQDGAPLVALAKDLEEEFRTGGGQGHEAQFVDDQQAEAGQLPLQIEQMSLNLWPERSALPRFHRRDVPGVVTQPVHFSTMALLDSSAFRMVMASEKSAPVGGLAGNSPVYSPGWKSPPFAAQGVAGKPGLFLPGRTVYFCHSSQGRRGMTLYGYARVSVREPEDKNLDLQVERLVRAGCSLGNIRSEEASGARNDRGGLLELLDLVAEGDTLMVTHIDRLSRGLTHGL